MPSFSGAIKHQRAGAGKSRQSHARGSVPISSHHTVATPAAAGIEPQRRLHCTVLLLVENAFLTKHAALAGSKYAELNVITMKEHIMTTTDTYSIVTAATVLIMIVTMAT